MIEEKVLDTLLDTPVKVEIDMLPKHIFHKLLQTLKIRPKKVVFEIRGATLRTMLRISKLLLSVKTKQLKSESDLLNFSYDSILSNTETLAKVIATAIHNKKSEVPKNLVDIILDNMTAKEVSFISDLVIEKLNVIAFISTISSIRGITLMEMSPKGSGEIIASGELSEA